jgi:hypothetical protein
MEFSAEVEVNRIEDVGAFIADLRIRCAVCGERFAFIGLPAGISSSGPRVGVSLLEAHLPIRPSSAKLGSGARFGFDVTVVEGTPAPEERSES